ncbi:MAG: hypothetical protein LH618_08075 [Saprospiraceae bacterium]|nr:hypothetical protein [Saprospiraceae bacterium]
MRTVSRFLFPALLLTCLLTACHTAKKYYESGDYDNAIEFCVRKLAGKSKKKIEYVQGLEVAFQKAQARDLHLITSLVNQNRDENWEKINRIHRQIRSRQQRVSPLLPLTASTCYRARIELVDINQLESVSCEKAAEYLYNQAETLLDKAGRGDRAAARSAYAMLLDVENRYFQTYKDKTELKGRARDLGTSYVLFEVKNQSDKVLPRAFAERILNIGKNDLDSEWKAFFFEAKSGVQYDYNVVFKVRNIDISPEKIHERAYTDEKEIQDGFDYVLDKKGNVRKDSLGNDLKTPRYVRLRAEVLEVFQTKAARLSGNLEVYAADRRTLLNQRDLGTEVVFENYASTFKGDRRALTEDSRRRIGNQPLPFPRDEDMLVQAADRLQPELRSELQHNRAIY